MLGVESLSVDAFELVVRIGVRHCVQRLIGLPDNPSADNSACDGVVRSQLDHPQHAAFRGGQLIKFSNVDHRPYTRDGQCGAHVDEHVALAFFAGVHSASFLTDGGSDHACLRWALNNISGSDVEHGSVGGAAHSVAIDLCDGAALVGADR